MFRHEVNFYQSVFHKAQFSEIEFKGESSFKFAVFEKEDKILFDVNDLSKVSFANTDITGIRFGESVRWGPAENEFKIIDERKLEDIEGDSSQRGPNLLSQIDKKIGVLSISVYLQNVQIIRLKALTDWVEL